MQLCLSKAQDFIKAPFKAPLKALADLYSSSKLKSKGTSLSHTQEREHCYAKPVEVSQFITCKNNADSLESLREQLGVSDWIYAEHSAYKEGWTEREEQLHHRFLIFEEKELSQSRCLLWSRPRPQQLARCF